MTDWQLYSQHLKRVSRSFAFCIERLESPFREWVGLAYILCRLVDTIEDSLWESSQSQQQSFRSFEGFISQSAPESKVQEWAAQFPINIPEGERELLKDASVFFSDLQDLPERVRKALQRTVLDMCHGMAHFTAGTGKGIRVKNIVEANQYCFFVAGIIGEMLTELLVESEPGYEISSEQLVNSYRFGLFLQKINLLKDQLSDLPEGRYLVPDREEMRQSLLGDGQGAINYILDIPVKRKDYRIFCAWSLFLGLGSLPYIDQTWKEQKPVKIPRAKTLLLLGKVELLINNNDKLKKLYNEMLISNFSSLEYTVEGTLKSRNEIWLYDYYHGKLTPEQMVQLGLV